MADVKLIVNEVLCFLKGKFETSTIKQLKIVLSSFYTADELAKAKEILFEIGAKIADESRPSEPSDNGGNWDFPKLTKRTGDGRVIRSTDDLIGAFVWMDERKLTGRLPPIYAENVNRIPLVKIEDIDMYVMAQKLERLDSRMARMESDASRVRTTGSIDRGSSSAGVRSGQGGRMNCLHPSSTSAPITSVDISSASSSAVTKPEDGVSQESVESAGINTTDDDLDFTKVSYKKPKQVKNSNVHSHPASKVSKMSRICGEAPTASLKAGVVIQSKAVFHVDNVDRDSSVDTIKEFLKTKNIEVITCFAVKSWMREHEHVAAYRICVPASDGSIFLDKSLWPKGIMVRNWKFKSIKNGN